MPFRRYWCRERKTLIDMTEFEYNIILEALEELRIKVKEEDDKSFIVCVGNKGYFNFN